MKYNQYQLFSVNLSIPLTISIIGLTAVTTQILTMREMSTIFQGNELSLGTILGVWLFWTGIGSLLFPKIPIWKHQPLTKISVIQLIITIILPLLLLFIRSSKYLLSLTPGEIIGYMPMLIISLVILAPFCLLSGLLYTTACQWVEKINGKGSRSIARVYVWEGVGAALGGLLASLFLITFVSPIKILIILASLNLFATLNNHILNFIRIKYLRIMGIVLLLCLFLFIGFYYSPSIQSFSDQLLWKGYNLIKTTNTAFGNVAVTKTGEQISMYHNGLHLFTLPDQLSAETSVHYALLQHKNPQQVLLVGGNVQASIAEALKYSSLTSLYYIELDPALITYALQYDHSGASKIISNPRVTIKNLDARLFIKQTKKKFDLVILNLPPPYTAQLNRFYTLEFFREIKKILKKDGIVSLGLEGAANVISPELSDYLGMIRVTLKKVFPEMVILPGETIRICASANKKHLTSDPLVLVERLRKKNINTEFIREYYLPFQLSQERREYVEKKIKPIAESIINYDLHPRGYYYHILLWSTAYMGGFKKIFFFFSRLKLWQVFSIFLIITFIIYIFKKNNAYSLSKMSVGVSLVGVGFSEISLEFMVILVFQVLHGYVYQTLAVLIAGYMIGLALGGWAGYASRIRNEKIPLLFRNIQLFMIFLPLFIGIIINVFHNVNIFSTNSSFLAFPFSVILIVCGFLGGFQFVLANHLFFTFGSSVSKTAGYLYCLDLIGSAGGVLLTSAFFIPILGINKTLIVLAFLNFVGFILLKISLKALK